MLPSIISAQDKVTSVKCGSATKKVIFSEINIVVYTYDYIEICQRSN